jgi:hypothetical protein
VRLAYSAGSAKPGWLVDSAPGLSVANAVYIIGPARAMYLPTLADPGAQLVTVAERAAHLVERHAASGGRVHERCVDLLP